MCPFGDIKDVPDSFDGKSGFFIVGSSCAICPLSKTVLHLPVACPSAQLESVTHQSTNQSMQGKDSATQALLSWKLSLFLPILKFYILLVNHSQQCLFLTVRYIC